MLSPDTISVRFLADLKDLVAGFAQAQTTVKQGVTLLNQYGQPLARVTTAATAAGTAVATMGRVAGASSGQMKNLGLQAASLGLGLSGASLASTRFGGTLLALAGVGGTPLFAAVAGLGVLAVAYMKLTESARAARKEQAEQVAALEKLRLAMFDPTAGARRANASADAELAAADEALKAYAARAAMMREAGTFDAERTRQDIERLSAAVALAKANVDVARSLYPTATVPLPTAKDRAGDEQARFDAMAKELTTLAELAEMHLLDAKGVDALRAAQDRLTASLDDQNMTQQRKLELGKLLSTIGGALVTPGSGGDDVAAKRDSTAEIEALARAEFNYEMELAHDSYERKRELILQALAVITSVYGVQSKEYFDMLTEMARLDREFTDEAERNALARAEFERAHQMIDPDKKKKEEEPLVDFGPLKASWNEALAGMLSGAHGFHAGVRGIFQGIGQVIDQTIIKMVNSWIAGHVKMLAISLANGLKDIAIKGAQAAAGAAASVAAIPFVGWLMAVPVALGVLAGVLALRHNLSSAEGGWGRVPFDQAALLHKNEMVLPASIADKVRGMADGSGGGGSATYNFTVHAVDAASFSTMLDRHDSVLVRKLHQVARDGRLG